nr:unnamed protein product [Callosobruchus chinensis]
MSLFSWTPGAVFQTTEIVSTPRRLFSDIQCGCEWETSDCNGSTCHQVVEILTILNCFMK